MTLPMEQMPGVIQMASVPSRGEFETILYLIRFAEWMADERHRWDPATGLGTPNYPKMKEFFLSLP
jgi:hypothetical protein